MTALVLVTAGACDSKSSDDGGDKAAKADEDGAKPKPKPKPGGPATSDKLEPLAQLERKVRLMDVEALPGGEQVAVYSMHREPISIIDLASGAVASTVDPPARHGERPLEISAAGKIVLGGEVEGKEQDVVWFLDPKTGASEELVLAFNGAIKAAVAVSPDGQTLALVGIDNGRILLINREGAEIAKIDRPEGSGVMDAQVAVFSPDGQTLAAGMGPHLRLIDPATGEIRHDVADYEGSIAQIAFSADGARVATNTTSSRDLASHVYEVASGNKVASIPAASKISGWLAVALDKDGSHAFVSAMPRVRQVRLSDGEVVAEHQLGAAAWDLALLPDGEHVVAAGDMGRVWMIPVARE